MSLRTTTVRIRGLVFATLVIAAATATSATVALGATAGADINDQGLENYSWKGWAVDMNRTWHYSWAIHLEKNSSTIDSHTKENITGTTSTSTPTYTNFIDPRQWGGKPYCTTFNLHHGTTVSSPLDSTYTACVPEQGIAPPASPPPIETPSSSTAPEERASPEGSSAPQAPESSAAATSPSSRGQSTISGGRAPQPGAPVLGGD